MPSSLWKMVVEHLHWQSFVSGGLFTALVIPALKTFGKWAWEKRLKGLVFGGLHYRRRDCGHWTGSYATDPRTGQTECLRCYQARMDRR
jgi:hypothetical protein